MKHKIVSLLKRPFRVSYRLTVLYKGDYEPRHTTNTDGRLLRNMARNTQDLADFWTLYKTGPFGLPEREIDCYMKGDVQ